jgi:flagellar biosynthesis protein FlhF
MRIRRFTARDMTEALKLVRDSLGSDAVILETRANEDTRGRKQGVTVLAAVDRHLEEKPETGRQFNRKVSPLRTKRKEINPIVAEPARINAGRPRPQVSQAQSFVPREVTRFGDDRPAPIKATAPVESEITSIGQSHRPSKPVEIAAGGNMKSEIERLSGRVSYLNRLISSDHFSHIPIPMRELYLDLVEAELDSNLTFALLRETAQENPPDIITGPRLAPLKKKLFDLTPKSQGILDQSGHQIAMLVGPPGAGKTTVAIAMAARLLQQSRRPGLISLDTFRAGGPVSLEQYARAMDVPFAALFDYRDLHSAASSALAGCDFLIIDTPGIGSADRDAVRMMGQIARLLTGPQVQLVLPSSSRVRDLAVEVDRFSAFRPTAMTFTKLDTTQNYGGILSLTIKTRVPVTYLNWGREFFEDFKPACASTLVDLVMDRCINTSWGESTDTETEGASRPAREAV